MNNHPKVFIVILNFNGKETIKDCLNSVLSSDYPNFEVVVVDNNSTDGSFEVCKEHFPRAHFIKNEKNIGFGAGNNIGIRFALEKMADYVFLLNNDALLNTDTLSKLVNASEKNSDIGILTPLIINGNDKIWFAGGEINWLKMKTTHTLEKPQNKLSTTQYATGCAMLIKQKFFEKVGLFDEDYFLYYEDADLSIRGKKKGFKNALLKNATVKHFEKSETNNENKIYWLVLSGLIFFDKHMPFYLRPWLKMHIFARKLKNQLFLTFKKESLLTKKISKAFNDFNHVK